MINSGIDESQNDISIILYSAISFLFVFWFHIVIGLIFFFRFKSPHKVRYLVEKGSYFSGSVSLMQSWLRIYKELL